MLALGVDRGRLVPGLRPVRGHKVVHRELNAVELTTLDGHVPGHGRTRAHDDRVEAGARLLEREVDADLDAGLEPGALGPHLGQPAVDVPLLELEVGDPVPERPAEAVVAFVDDDRVPGAGEPLGRGESRRARADDGDGVPGDPVGDLGLDETGGEALVDDAHLDLLDRHSGLVDAEHARVLTRRRTRPAGEFGGSCSSRGGGRRRAAAPRGTSHR